MDHKSMLDYNGDPQLKDKFREMIAVNAYFRAEKRGFEPGHELDDWLNAEHEILNIYRNWFE